MDNDIRVMNTPSLVALAEDSIAQGYNRTIDPAWIKRYADNGGYHVGRLLIFNHKANDPGLKSHHRVEILFKSHDSQYPTTLIVDVTASLWNWLYTVDEWKEMEEESRKPEPNFLKIGEKYGRVKYVNA